MSKIFPSFEFLDETFFEPIGEVLASMRDNRLGIVDMALSDIEQATAHIPEISVTPAINIANTDNTVDLDAYRKAKLAEKEQKIGGDLLQTISQEDKLAALRAMIKDMAA